jgi:hypothetical protein
MRNRRPTEKSTDKEKESEEKEEDKGPNVAMKMLGTAIQAPKILTLFEPFSINVGQRNNITAYGLTGLPSLNFQFGLDDSLGVPIEQTSGGGANFNRGQSSENTSFSTSSGFALTRDVKVTFKYDESFSLNSSTTTTGQRSKSWLIMGDDVNMFFPNWSVRVGGLEKLPIVNKYVQRLSIDHNYSGKHNETFNVDNAIEEQTQEDFDSQFRPFIGITMSWQNGVSMQVQYNKSERTSFNRKGGVGGTKQNTSDISITGSYSKSSNFRIPIWPFNMMRLKNNIDLQVTFNMSTNSTLKSRAGNPYEVTAETSKWYFKPSVRYSFSDRVRGGAHFEIGKTHNKLIGDSSYKEFMIDVNISIRGS